MVLFKSGFEQYPTISDMYPGEISYHDLLGRDTETFKK